MFLKTAQFLANGVDSDQILYSATSDQGYTVSVFLGLSGPILRVKTVYLFG